MSADKGGPRDWDKELAQIDKLMAQERTEPPPTKPVKGAPAVPGEPAAKSMKLIRHTPLFTWVRLTLALGVGMGMAMWPYTHGCGFGLFAYLAGTGTVIVASFWTMVSSWKSRSSIAHFLSIALLFWGTFLAARELLPRVGYAKQTATWTCHV